jgi:ABC-type polysaccharide/polyol phosphate export permease
VTSLRIAKMLAVQDLSLSYRRSTLGPFWLTISTAVQIATIGIVFSTIFQADVAIYVPYLATSLILFTFITSSLTESNLAFINSDGIIRQVKFPASMYVGRTLLKSLMIFAHNLVIVPVTFLVLGRGFDVVMLWAIPGLILVVANLWWMGHLLALVSVRFRDFPPIFGSIVTIAFYLTPVMWMADQIPDGNANPLIAFNPLFHLLELVRAPLMGEFTGEASWLVCTVMFVLGSLVALLVVRRHEHKIALWV